MKKKKETEYVINNKTTKKDESWRRDNKLLNEVDIDIDVSVVSRVCVCNNVITNKKKK